MTLSWMPTKGAKSKRLAEARFRQLMYQASLEDEESLIDTVKRQIPDAWRTLELDLDVSEPRDKVTLYLDRSLVRMFKGMGKGYQARINRILATWMQMKIAENSALGIEMMDQLFADGKERKRSDDASDYDDMRQKLAEHWAYNEGVLDVLEGERGLK